MKIEEYVKHFDLNTGEQKVLYILHDQIEKGNYKITIRELSELSFMATSSIVRLAKKVGFDPAVMASPFITTIVDALSLIVYFQFATHLLRIKT